MCHLSQFTGGQPTNINQKQRRFDIRQVFSSRPFPKSQSFRCSMENKQTNKQKRHTQHPKQKPEPKSELLWFHLTFETFLFLKMRNPVRSGRGLATNSYSPRIRLCTSRVRVVATKRESDREKELQFQLECLLFALSQQSHLFKTHVPAAECPSDAG